MDVSLSTGRRFVREQRGRTLTLPKFGRAMTATVRVRGIDVVARKGRVTTARIKALKKVKRPAKKPAGKR